MFAKLRNLSSNVLVKSLLIALAVSLVIWGVKTGYSTRDYVAVVGKSNYIYREDFTRAKKNFLRTLGQVYQSQGLDESNVNQIVLDSLIQNELLKVEGASLGLLTGEDVAFEEIRNMPVFKNSEGKFDKTIFKQVLYSNGMSESRLVQSIKDDISVSILNSMFTAYKPSEDLVKAFFDHNEQRRLIDLVTIRPAKGEINYAPTDTEIEQYYVTNKIRFAVDELRDVEYITITPSMYKNTVKLSDEELRQASPKATDKATIMKIRENLLEAKRSKAMHNDIKLIEDEIAEGINLKEIAKKHKLQYVFVEKYDKASKASNIPVFEQFNELVFSSDEGAPSEPIAIQKNNISAGYFIVNVSKIYQSHYKKLDDELKKQIATYVLETQKERICREEALKIYNLIISGKKTLEQVLAENLNVSLEKITVGRVESKGSTIDTNLLAMIFSAKDKNSYTNISKSREIYAFQFAIVKEIKLPALTPYFDKIKAIETQLSHYLTDATKQEFLSHLQSKYPVKIFPDTIKEL